MAFLAPWLVVEWNEGLGGFRSLGQCSWRDGFVGGGFLSCPFDSRSTAVAETASQAGARVQHHTSHGIGGRPAAAPDAFLARDFFFHLLIVRA
jgi:hypothetical protein